MKPEYREGGPEVAEKFEEAMKLLFLAPKRQTCPTAGFSGHFRHSVGR